MKPWSRSLDMATIAREHYPTVYRFCARRVGIDRAPDVTQETFVTAQKALGKYRGESSLSTWLLGIAHNECRRASRTWKLEPLGLDYETSVVTGATTESTLVDREALRVAMNKLSSEHREVVFLHELEGRTYDEIAEVLGVPVGTVKSRLHHAFLNLRRALAGEELVMGSDRGAS